MEPVSPHRQADSYPEHRQESPRHQFWKRCSFPCQQALMSEGNRLHVSTPTSGLLCPAACRFSCLTAVLQVSLFKNVYLCSWLCQVCWPAGTFVAVCGISSLTRDPSQAPGLGSAESEPLDPQGSSCRKSSHHFVEILQFLLSFQKTEARLQAFLPKKGCWHFD